MAENKLVSISTDFAVEIIQFSKTAKISASLLNQMLRSGTSIGANIREANYAQSMADFISKLQISLKECYETEYWIELFERTDMMIPEKANAFRNQCGHLRRLLISSINTAKSAAKK